DLVAVRPVGRHAQLGAHTSGVRAALQEQDGAALGDLQVPGVGGVGQARVDGLVARVEDQPVDRLQGAVQGAVGEAAVEEVGGEGGQDVGALRGHGLAVGGAQALDDVDLRAGFDAEDPGQVRVGRDRAPVQVDGARTQAAGEHVLGERDEPQRHFDLGPGHERALARDAVQPPFAAELVDPLPDGHAGQAVPGAQLALRRYRGVDGQFRALDQVEQDRAELEVLRYGTVRVDGRHEGPRRAASSMGLPVLAGYDVV